MTMWLRQSTARTIVFGPFLDSTNGVDAETGLTISQADIRLSKNGGAFAQTNNAAGATHMENGYYAIPLNTTDTGTLGILRVAVHEAGALPVWQDFMVVPANVWDSMFGADLLDVSMVQVAGSAVDAAAAQLGVNVVNWKGSAAAAMTGDAYARLGAPAGASVSADVAAVKVDTAAVKAKTDNLPASPAAVGSAMQLAAGAVNAAAIATDAIDGDAIAASAVTEIQSGLATAAALSTVAGYIDTEVASILAAVDTEVGAIKGVTDKLDTAVELDGATYRFTTNALEQAPAGGGGATAADIADAVWDELVADHAGVGSTGAALAAAGGSGDPWATALPGAYGAGTAGKLIGDNVNAPIGTVDTVVDAIKAKTDNLPSDPADQSAVEAAITAAHSTTNGKIDAVDDFVDTEVAAILTAVDTEVAAIKAKTDNLPASPAAVGSAMTLANGAITAAVVATDAIDADALAADAATEIADALLKRDMSAVSGEAARSPLNALRALRNKVAISGSTMTVNKEDDSTSAWTAAVTTSASAEPITAVDPA